MSGLNLITSAGLEKMLKPTNRLFLQRLEEEEQGRHQPLLGANGVKGKDHVKMDRLIVILVPIL